MATPTDAQMATPTDAQMTTPTDAQMATPTDAQMATPTDAQMATPTSRGGGGSSRGEAWLRLSQDMASHFQESQRINQQLLVMARASTQQRRRRCNI
ncbi:hypothetical protein S40288_11311, partial [Stachybotrys chartarum IBT 40288]